MTQAVSVGRARLGLTGPMVWLACVLTLMPYLSPGRLLPSQVQPWAALLAWAVVIVASLRGRRVQADMSVALMLLFTTMMLVYFPWDVPVDLADLVRKTIGIPLSIGLVILGQNIDRSTLRSAVWVAACAYLFGAILQYVSTSAYLSVVRPFVDVVNIQIGSRGAASFAPEATDLGFTMAFLLLIALLTYSSSDRRSRTAQAVLVVIILTTAALSQSGTGIIASIVVLSLWLVQRLSRARKGLAIGALAVLAAILVYAVPSDEVTIRGFALLQTSLSDPSALLQTSFAHRIVHNLVAVIAFVSSAGLGFGAASFTVVAPEIYVNYRIPQALDLSSYYSAAVLETLGTNALSVTAQLLTEFGVVGLSLIALLVMRVARSRVRFKLAVGALLIFTWLQSFPAAYPPFWLLIGLVCNEDFTRRPPETSRKGTFEVSRKRRTVSVR